jgi:hypothetical protein
MRCSYRLLWVVVLLATAGCNKAGDPQAAPKSDYEAMAASQDAADEERAARAHLTASMTDEQILRAIGVEPATVKLKPAPEGYGGPSFKKQLTQTRPLISKLAVRSTQESSWFINQTKTRGGL